MGCSDNRMFSKIKGNLMLRGNKSYPYWRSFITYFPVRSLNQTTAIEQRQGSVSILLDANKKSPCRTLLYRDLLFIDWISNNRLRHLPAGLAPRPFFHSSSHRTSFSNRNLDGDGSSGYPCCARIACPYVRYRFRKAGSSTELKVRVSASRLIWAR